MDPKPRPFGFAGVTLATAVLWLSCGGSEPAATATSGGMPAASGVESGGIGATGAMATSGEASTAGVANTTGATNPASALATSSASATSGQPGTMGGPVGSGGTGGMNTAGDGTGGASTDGVTTATNSGTTAGTGDSAPSAGCGSPAGLASGRASIEVGDKMREYILYIPEDYDPNHAYKLIFGWHPWGGSAQQTESMGYFGLESVSNGQAILVAPEGQDYQGNGLGWGNEDGEDVDFLHAMLDRFGSELCIDNSRIFSTGFSFGAMFSFTLACSQDSMMRAIAPQAGNATTSGRCEDGTRPVATMAFIGVDDTLLDGHRQAVDLFVERNGCASDPMTMQTSWCDELSSMYEPCTCVQYPNCEEGYPVIACEYQAGHVFAPNSGATIWNFFSQF